MSKEERCEQRLRKIDDTVTQNVTVNWGNKIQYKKGKADKKVSINKRSEEGEGGSEHYSMK